jgi:acyl-CoA thioester hydrolase
MPLTFERSFRVRNYECDANGHLNSANYLRMMQETAFDASAAGGYGMRRYAEMNRYWLIRATEIEYLRPLYYDERLTIRTWISDFRRVSSRRRYDFCLEGSGELCAQAHTDWVFLDATTQQPAKIPPTLARDFYPEGVPASFPPRVPFPEPPAPPPGVFTIHRRVEWGDLDPMQHVNNAVYMDYANECGFLAVAAFQWPWERIREAGFAILLRRVQIQYLLPALLGDKLEIATWASGVKRSTATRHYTIRRARDGALLCQMNMLGVWIDLATSRPIRIPPQFLADFASNITNLK